MTENEAKVLNFLKRQTISLTTSQIATFKGLTSRETSKALHSLEKQGWIIGQAPILISMRSGISPRSGQKSWLALESQEGA